MRGIFQLPKNVWLLTLILSLAMSVGALMILIGGVVGTQLSPTASLSTLPVAIMIVGTAVGVIPVTRSMGKWGRKPVFIVVSLLACLASILAAIAVFQQHFYLFLAAGFGLGVAISGFQQIRFAAMESVELERAPKAASTVLLGGLVAAVVGPELATLGSGLLATQYVGSFALMALLCGVCAVLFMFMQETHNVSVSPVTSSVGVSGTLKQPKFIIALSASVVGYALMSFIMTATPVHMHVTEHHSLEQAKWVIQSHILAMYLPSLISGVLIAKLGVYRIMVAGIVIYFLTIIIASSGNSLYHYWLALILLGIGWNFLFLGGTVLLPQTYAADQKFTVQSINEFAVFSAQGLASLGAGVLLFSLGWKGLMMVSIGVIFCYVLLLLWQGMRLKQTQKNSF